MGLILYLMTERDVIFKAEIRVRIYIFFVFGFFFVKWGELVMFLGFYED